MRTADFDYVLPPAQIAQQPADPRDASRLMRFPRNEGAVTHYRFSDLPSLLTTGDLLVVNNTRVMAARLYGRREGTGGGVEALLVRRLRPRVWEVLFRPARQAVAPRRFTFDAKDGPLAAVVIGRDSETVTLEFERDFDPATVGEVPLPPYITGFAGDPERYQTIFNGVPESAAAPTAGLHFTPGLLDRLQLAGVAIVEVNLAVGPGTFKPVKVEDPREHQLHAEHVEVGVAAAATIEAARSEGRRVIAVGTTVVRTLEHVAREAGRIAPYAGWTSLRILPGEPFLVIDGMITNFHLPKSTLLMLVAAFAGTDRTMDAYRTAVAEGYRFYSFGDAMLVV